jgi:hypothetical protein
MSRAGRRITVALALLVLVSVAVAFALPTVLELRRISAVMSQYRLEAAVHKRAMENRRTATLEAVIHPPFMKKYGLELNDYLDSQGYFAPNGTHWARWPLQTRTAAILMFADKSFPTAWSVRQAIQAVDAYYASNDRSTPLVYVVSAIARR